MLSWARICKRLWSPEIDSEESSQLSYVAWRTGTTNRVVVPVRQAGNRFLGSLKGLQIRALIYIEQTFKHLLNNEYDFSSRDATIKEISEKKKKR